MDDQETTKPVETGLLAAAPQQMEVVKDAATKRKDEFIEKLTAARAPKPPAPAPQPVSHRISEKTRIEMEAGRKRSEYFAEQAANRPPMPRPENEGGSTPVFRPISYVPDQLKGQGNVNASVIKG